jgi:NADH:ubiquinone oxidoreductase subunit 3 (subunit A)
MLADNTVICSNYPTRNQHPVTHRRLATVTPDAVRELPRIFLNCILGVAAAHMAVRTPGNRSASQLALETKVSVFECMSVAFQQAHQQRADVLYACILLMFNMEVRMSLAFSLATTYTTFGSCIDASIGYRSRNR